MATQIDLPGEHHVLAVSGPGGTVARQFRVQYHSEIDPTWRMYASYQDRVDAEACLQKLRHSGCPARLVGYTIAPAAA